MTAAELLQAISRAGGRVMAGGGDLVLEAAQPLPEDLLALIKAHKAELLAALSGKINRWRVTHADGQVTEHSSAGLTRSEALDLARLFGEPVKSEPLQAPPETVRKNTKESAP